MADTDTSENQPPPQEQTEEAPKAETEESKEAEEEDSDEWKAEKYRTKVVERIQDEITKTESQVPKSAADLEEFVFSKAKSRKGYLDLVARVLIYVAEFNKKKEEKQKKEEEEEGKAEGEKEGEKEEEQKEEAEKQEDS